MMEDQALSSDLIEQIRDQILQKHPEMQGGKMSVAPRRRTPEEAAAAAKLGLPVSKDLPGTSHYVVTMSKEVQAEDGVTIPLIVRVTVDEQGQIVKQRKTR
jgi:hypothetical protein